MVRKAFIPFPQHYVQNKRRMEHRVGRIPNATADFHAVGLRLGRTANESLNKVDFFVEIKRLKGFMIIDWLRTNNYVFENILQWNSKITKYQQ